MNFTSVSRVPAALAVLLLHLLLGALLLQQRAARRDTAPTRAQLRWIETQPQLPAPLIPVTRPLPTRGIQTPSLATAPSPFAITLPDAPPAEPAPSAAAASTPSTSMAPAPLNLNLPTAIHRHNAPLTPADQANLDPRANSLRESAEQRMANALGAKGWTQIDGVQGGRMLRGPHGECVLIRPSMVNEIPDHPHAGLVIAKASGCGELQKGARIHKRPGS